MRKSIHLPNRNIQEIKKLLRGFNDKKWWNSRKNDNRYFIYKAEKNHGFRTVPSQVFCVQVYQEQADVRLVYWILPGISSLISFIVGFIALLSGIRWSIGHHSFSNWTFLVLTLMFNVLFAVWYIQLKNKHEQELKAMLLEVEL